MKIHSADVLTVPNALSATGFALAVHGANNLDTQAGLLETAAGRLLDLADGHVARATGQCSELGAAVDATLDKFAGLAIIANEWRKDTAPKISLISILGQNIVNGVATVAAMKRHPETAMTSSREGKYAMAVQNLALAAYAQSAVTSDKRPKTRRVLRGVGHASTVVGVGYFGLKATADYVRRAR